MSQTTPTRLFTFKSIILLCIVSIVSLVLLFPSRTKLLALVEDSSTAEISLAFLKQLYSDDESNPDISLSMAKNYVKKGEYTAAIEILEALIKQDMHKQNQAIVQDYINTLFQQNNALEGVLAEKLNSQLARFAAEQGLTLNSEIASNLANIAIQLGKPAIALQYLAPFADIEGDAAYTILIPLALQSENFYDAIAYATQLFAHQQTLENAKQLLDLLLSVNSKVQMRNFVNNYAGPLREAPEFLKTTADYARKSGNFDSAQQLIDELIALEPSAYAYNQASNIALERGELESAAKYLEQALAIAPSADGYLKLNQIYRWLGNILLAQRSSVKSATLHPNETAIRNGIDESKALDDLANAGKLYAELSANNFVKQQEYDEWIDAIEKGLGFDAASKSLLDLFKNRPNDPKLMSHNARLSSYTNSHQLVVDTLQKLALLRPLTYQEIARGANAYIMLDKPGEALAIMKSGPNWQEAPNDYIEMLASLAYDNSDRELAMQTQQFLKDQGSDAFSTYQYIRLLTPVNQQSVEKLLPIYESSQDNALLFTLLSYASEANDKALFEQLVVPTLRRQEYDKIPDILLWQAQYYENNNNAFAAKEVYLKMLSNDPNNEGAINNLLWFALNENDKTFLEKLYVRAKEISVHRPNLWLAMASASEHLEKDAEALAWYRKLLLADSILNESASSTLSESISLQKSSPSVLLNYASLLARSGNNKHAYAIRKYLFAHKSAQLLALPGGEISYRSLVGIFVNPSLAKRMVVDDTLQNPSQANIEALFAQNLANFNAYKILFWQQQKAFSNFNMPDWQQLSLAIQNNDLAKVNHLLDTSTLLSMPDRYIAYLKTGRQQEAWQLGEANIGKSGNIAQQKSLVALQAQLHPIKTHSVQIQHMSVSPWNMDRLSLEYLSPHQFGNWRLKTYSQELDGGATNIRSIDAKEVGIGAAYFYQLANSAWQVKLDFANGLGANRMGILGEYTQTFNDYTSATVHAGINMPNQFSRLMYIAGKEDSVGVDVAYRPTARESIILNTSYKALSTRFGDDIGKGWGMNLRLTEQFLFNDPALQVYANVAIQKYSLNDSPLSEFNQSFSADLLNKNPYRVRNFAQEDFQRISFGQRFENGVPGVAGRSKPSPTYWLDTSLGYNQISKELDLAISTGLGIRIVGDDELYFKLDWQSADRNGEETLFLSLGYIYGL